jgi:hypothetical protein
MVNEQKTITMKQQTTVTPQQLSGDLSIQLANGQTLDDFCQSHIAEYNRDRFEAIAIRVFVSDESIVTVYALDKMRQENTTLNPDKIPVKKFKLEDVPLNELLTYCQGFNCTLSTGNFPIEAMEVINK